MSSQRRIIMALMVSVGVHAVLVSILPAPRPEPRVEEVSEPVVLALARLVPQPTRSTGDRGADDEERPGTASDASGTVGGESPDEASAATPDRPEPDPAAAPATREETTPPDLHADEPRVPPEAERRPKPPRDRKKPPPPEEPTPPAGEKQEFVWTDEASGAAADVAGIAAHDRSDEVRARPEANEGEPGPHLDGIPSKRSGNPRPVTARRSELTQAAAGRRQSPDSPTDVRDSVVDDPADDPGEGTGRELLEQRKVVELTDAAPVEVQLEEHTLPISGRPGAQQPSGRLETELPVPDWWSPLAARVTGQRGPTTTTTATEPTPPRPLEDTTPQEVLPDPTRDPEQQDVADTRDEEPTPVPERQTESHDADESEELAGGEAPAKLTEPFALRRATRASFDEASDVQEVAVPSRATPLGRWTHEISEELRTRWSQVELPMLQRAFGVQGTVVIAFRVARSGRVQDVRVVEPSGNAGVDAQARLVIPARLPRPPEHRPVDHEVAFELR